MIIILGAGIIGLFSAYNLLKEGKQVKIFDSKNISGNATDASVGMLSPAIEAKPGENELYYLMKESKNIWNNFYNDNKLRNKTGLKNNGSLMVALNEDDEEKLKFKQQFFKKIGYECNLLSSSETLKLEPCLNSNIKSSLFCKDQDQVNTKTLKNFLIEEIKEMGGEIFYGEKIRKLTLKEDKSVTFNELNMEFEKLIISCGSWSNEIISNSFGFKFPLIPLKGVSLLVDSLNDQLNYNLWFRNIYVAPRKNGKLAIGATEEEKGFDDSVKLDELYFLTKSIWESFPKLEEFKLDEINVGLRPSVIDGYPILGPISNTFPNIICCFGHYRHGILLAPITAEIMTKYALNKNVHDKYKYFSPSRFNL